MELRDRPAVLRRGAAPPSAQASFWLIVLACGLHLSALTAFWIKLKPPKEYAVAGGVGPQTRARLIRIAPLRSFPSPDVPVEEAPKARPRPALVKRYTPGAKVVVRPERVQPKKNGKGESAKPPQREVTPGPAADTSPRWVSSDGSRAASVRTDGDFRFAYYLAALRNKIGSRWVPPQGMSGPVKAVLYFRIGKDGQVTMNEVETSSGYAFYDQTTVRALLSATPLPPLPAGFTDQYLGVHFAFELQ